MIAHLVNTSNNAHFVSSFILDYYSMKFNAVLMFLISINNYLCTNNYLCAINKSARRDKCVLSEQWKLSVAADWYLSLWGSNNSIVVMLWHATVPNLLCYNLIPSTWVHLYTVNGQSIFKQ